MNEEQKQNLMKKSGFKCQKCGYYSPLGKGLEINRNHHNVLCYICNQFAPDNKGDFEKYVQDKIDHSCLETFRKLGKGVNQNLKKGMIESAKKGKIVSRPAFGYKIENSQLIPAENFDQVREIFESFINESSLNSIAKLHKMSVNGIKKILKNFTYIGKVKFDNQILPGNHKPIISSELFNKVQQRFEDLKKD